jgi:hypothetical protein
VSLTVFVTPLQRKLSKVVKNVTGLTGCVLVELIQLELLYLENTLVHLISGFSTVANDTVVTGGTYTAGQLYLNNTGGTFNVTGFSTGGGVDVFVTGGTYTAGTATFRNTGGTFNVTGFSTISYWSAGTGTYGYLQFW